MSTFDELMSFALFNKDITEEKIEFLYKKCCWGISKDEFEKVMNEYLSLKIFDEEIDKLSIDKDISIMKGEDELNAEKKRVKNSLKLIQTLQIPDTKYGLRFFQEHFSTMMKNGYISYQEGKAYFEKYKECISKLKSLYADDSECQEWVEYSNDDVREYNSISREQESYPSFVDKFKKNFTFYVYMLVTLALFALFFYWIF